MRVLLAHNYYDSSSPSGENAAVDDELDLLAKAGIDVVPLLFTSDDLRSSRREQLKAVGSLLAPRTGSLSALLRRVAPDVVHLHNTIPNPGPGLAKASVKLKVPVVQTVHNRRLAPCLNGVQVLNGETCVRCAGQTIAWQGVQHACYRGSRAQSAVVAASFALQHDGWYGVNHYFAVSPQIAAMLREQVGVPPTHVSVKPNPIPDPGVSAFPTTTQFLFAGRMDAAKGFDLLLESWRGLQRNVRPRLLVCGSGPLEAAAVAAEADEPDFVFLRNLPPRMIAEQIASSSVIVVPSIGGEGLPRIIAESFAAGRPVFTTDFDPLATLVGFSRGWVAEPNLTDLRAKMLEITRLPMAQLAEKGQSARRYYESNFHPSAVLAKQVAIYAQLIAGAPR